MFAMDRWTCLRCFTANDDSVMECTNCGLLRGATPPAGTEQPPPTGARAGAARGIVRRVLPFAIFGAIAFGGYLFAAQRGDNGEITQGGSLPIADVREGDCFDLPESESEETNDVDARLCDEAHQFEMMFVGDMPAGDYPVESAFETFVADACLPAFETYVGLAYEDSALDIFWFYPTADTWDSGDQSVQCAVYDPLESELTSSVEHANR
jgi:Septum formation